MPQPEASLPFTPMSTAAPRTPREPTATRSPRTPRGRMVAGPAVIPMQGQITPSRFSSAPRAFSHFTYSGDSYAIAEKMRRPQSPRTNSMPSNASVRHELPFKICGVPNGPRHTGTFAVFTYDVDPFERRQAAKKLAERQEADRVRAGAFMAGGRRKADKRSMQSRLPELLKGVHHSFRSDWLAYHSMTVDARGYVLALFSADEVPAHRRADLHAYMNRFIGHNQLATQFGAPHVERGQAVHRGRGRSDPGGPRPVGPLPGRRSRSSARPRVLFLHAGLTRDPTRWGIAHRPEAQSDPAPHQHQGADFILFAIRPPWVPNEPHAAVRPRTTATLGKSAAQSSP